MTPFKTSWERESLKLYQQVKLLQGSHTIYHIMLSCIRTSLQWRGLNILEVSVSQLWWAGPEWLSIDTPISFDIEPTPITELCLPELKTSSKLSHNLLANKRRPTSRRCDILWTFQGPSKATLSHCIYTYVLRAMKHIKAKGKSDTIFQSHWPLMKSQKAPLNWPCSPRCSSMCESQWSERDPYRSPTKVLGR